MRNYIILNGTKSTLINGLLISTLPPISKPLLRTQTDVIDGRDGDIVTPLGYSAYDKEIEIGLYGEYDVDAIINYFASAGTVTFSNEPTKYYNYQIFNQIDFEKLIRYRTAKVTMHVQPFKYSTIETAITHQTTRSLSITNQTINKNGLTVTSTNNAIKISGTATAATEIYLQINSLSLTAGDYVLSAAASGTGATAFSMRLINDSPSNANSFGGNYVTLQNNNTVTIYANLTDTRFFNYVYFLIAASQNINCTLNLSVSEQDASTFTVTNTGNYIAKPKITLYGSGTIDLTVNGATLFIIALGDEGYITIDSAAQEAYQDNTDNLKNRLVTGDYSNLVFNVGSNIISASGNVTDIIVENYSRWL